MYNLTRIPGRLNGYNMIAVLPKLRFGGRLDPDQVVILGYDPSRKHSKYVTAYVGISGTRPIREWYWGNYIDDFATAITSLLRRSGMTPDMIEAELIGGEKI